MADVDYLVCDESLGQSTYLKNNTSIALNVCNNNNTTDSYLEGKTKTTIFLFSFMSIKYLNKIIHSSVINQLKISKFLICLEFTSIFQCNSINKTYQY